MFSKKDGLFSLVLGEMVAWLMLPILKNLKSSALADNLLVYFWLWPAFLPLIVLAGLFMANLIGRKIKLVWQIGKFGAVGVLNTLVDWGVLNLLIFLTSVASGYLYPVFKAISFVVALLNSYVWNKFWTFDRQEQQQKVGREFLQFTIISLIGFAVNVGTATLIVNVLGRPAGVSANLWANAGALAGSILGMTWNFLGYKLVVFKNK